jgi:hypothetical protein
MDQNQNQKPNSIGWIQEDQQTISIQWKEPFYYSKSIKWRDLIIHTDISFALSELGYSTNITFEIDGVTYRFGLGKWKYMMGGTGVRPVIICQTHKLNINLSFFKLSLTEVALEKSDQDEDNFNVFSFFDR